MPKINIDFRHYPDVVALSLNDKVEHYREIRIKGESAIVTDESGRSAWIEVDEKVQLECKKTGEQTWLKKN
jgi:hypothetical protein